MIRISDLVKSYRGTNGTVLAVGGISLRIEEGQFVSLLGPSGCGKTSILRCIAGLEKPDEGEIEIDGRVLFSHRHNIEVPPNRRNLGMVFQSYAIWPHMTVFENTAFPLRVMKRAPKETQIRERVTRTLAIIGLEEMAERNATQLSGGQQQRLALARALVTEPQVLLLDEPLSNLDARLRDQMRSELRKLQRRLGVTTVYVTHDQTEALAMSTTVVVMNKGQIVQEGTPRDIYSNPINRFVAEFIGAANFIGGVWTALGPHNGVIETEFGSLKGHTAEAIVDGTDAILAVRPEDITIHIHALSPHAFIPARVRSVTYLGEQNEVELEVGSTVLRVRQHPRFELSEGTRVHIEFNAGAGVAIPVKTLAG
jgi:iron(III) transport system ATP-binding protein